MEDAVIDFLKDPVSAGCRTVAGNCEPGKGRFNLERAATANCTTKGRFVL